MTTQPEGFVYDLDEREYHADRNSLSVSGAKTLLRAPALFRWQQDNPVHKDVFDFGSAAHQEVLGIGPGTAIIPATSRAKADQEAHKAAKEAARADGKIPLTAEDAEKVDAMAGELRKHALAMRLLREGEPEVSAYALDSATGVMRRGRFDWLGANVLTDYKTAASVDPADLAGRYGSIKKWGYDAQAAWYTDLARDLGHPASAFAFIFQSKEPPYLVTVAYIRDDDLWEARQRNQRALELFRDCTATGQWPAYIADDSAAVVSLTQQTYDTERIA
jgi:hypothetical protein